MKMIKMETKIFLPYSKIAKYLLYFLLLFTPLARGSVHYWQHTIIEMIALSILEFEDEIIEIEYNNEIDLEIKSPDYSGSQTSKNKNLSLFHFSDSFTIWRSSNPLTKRISNTGSFHLMGF